MPAPSPAPDVTTGELAEQLGRLLRDARGDTPLMTMAERIGIHRNSLRELETGHRGDGTPVNPTLARVESIAAAYGVRLRFEVDDA